MGMRILLLLSLTWIMRLTQPLFTALNHGFSGRDLILISGGLFLLWKATVEIHDKLEGEEAHGTAKVAPSFAAVIGQIMVLDIIFSLDSVITAVGMANDIAIMITAVVVAVAIMMFSARTIGDFVMRHPTVKVLALSFLLMIGLTLIADGVRLPHSEGLHLLRDGLLDLRGDDQPATSDRRVRRCRLARTGMTRATEPDAPPCKRPMPYRVIVRFRKCAMVPGPTHRATAPVPCAPDLTSFDDQRRLRLIVHVQARLFAAHLDLDLRPLARHQVHVGLVLFRRLLAQPLPRPRGMRDVLRGMVAAHLIVRAPIGRPQVERVVGLPSFCIRKAMPTKPRAPSPAPGAGAPAISASITPFENSRS